MGEKQRSMNGILFCRTEYNSTYLHINVSTLPFYKNVVAITAESQ